MIVLKHIECGAVFHTDENTKLPERCTNPKCRRPDHAEFEVIGIHIKARRKEVAPFPTLKYPRGGLSERD